MFITTTTQIVFNCSPLLVYRHIEQCGTHLHDFMKRYGPIPGVIHTKPLVKKWGTPGSKRLVSMDDGSTAIDHILIVNKPHFFSYDVINFTSPLKYFIKKIHGEWNLQDQGKKTLVTWKYALEPKSLIYIPFLSLFVKLFLNTYLTRTLIRMKNAYSE